MTESNDVRGYVTKRRRTSSKARYWERVYSKQVPRGKGEKDLEKGVQSTRNRIEGSGSSRCGVASVVNFNEMKTRRTTRRSVQEADHITESSTVSEFLREFCQWCWGLDRMIPLILMTFVSTRGSGPSRNTDRGVPRRDEPNGISSHGATEKSREGIDPSSCSFGDGDTVVTGRPERR